MRKELNGLELEQVAGGTVQMNQTTVGFSTLNEAYALKNCTYREARNFVDDLLDENPSMTNAQFDAFVKQQLKAKGWI